MGVLMNAADRAIVEWAFHLLVKNNYIIITLDEVCKETCRDDRVDRLHVDNILTDHFVRCELPTGPVYWLQRL